MPGGHRQGLLEAQAEIERITHGDELLLVSNDHDVYVDGVKGAMLEFFPSDPKISLALFDLITFVTTKAC